VEQNVAPSELKPREQNVVSTKLKIQMNQIICGLKLTMVTICNSMIRSFPIHIENFDQEMVGKLF
jgi:hypothetical protein